MRIFFYPERNRYGPAKASAIGNKTASSRSGVECDRMRNMAMEEPKDKPESKFAEVIRKGREKREGLNRQSLDRENIKDAEELKIIRDSQG
jgi:hypothetical protein